MGAIFSVSLPSGATCRPCDCVKKCYARKLERLRPSVRKAYQNNLEILKSDPETYWREVEAAIMMSRFFRFHVSGDIPDRAYFSRMIAIAKRNQHCQILCFTKKYQLINDSVIDGQAIPENLHILFSGWIGLPMENPFRFPEAHVKYRDGLTTARSDAQKCGGNCTVCGITHAGCWTLRPGEQIVFDEH